MAFVESKTCIKVSHVYASTYKQCPICKRLSQDKWTKLNSERIVSYKKDYIGANRVTINADKKEWYQDNKEEKKAYEVKYRVNNRGKHIAARKKYKEAKRKAAPKWLTKEQLKQIERYYTVAAWIKSILGEPIDVDHIVPLQGTNVRGLHVPWNLQLLTRQVNCEKSNK